MKTACCVYVEMKRVRGEVRVVRCSRPVSPAFKPSPCGGNCYHHAMQAAQQNLRRDRDELAVAKAQVKRTLAWIKKLKDAEKARKRRK